jgi:hypothetical protein
MLFQNQVRLLMRRSTRPLPSALNSIAPDMTYFVFPRSRPRCTSSEKNMSCPREVIRIKFIFHLLPLKSRTQITSLSLIADNFFAKIRKSWKVIFLCEFSKSIDGGNIPKKNQFSEKFPTKNRLT